MRLQEYLVGSQATAKKFEEGKEYSTQDRNKFLAILGASRELMNIAGQYKKEVFHKHEESDDTCEYRSLREFDCYPKFATSAAPYSVEHQSLIEGTIGIVDEAGEVAELVEQVVLGNEVKNLKELLTKELGDVLWYIAEVAKSQDINLGDVAMRNLEKLEKRYKGGFSAIASMNREEEERMEVK